MLTEMPQVKVSRKHYICNTGDLKFVKKNMTVQMIPCKYIFLEANIDA